MNARVYLLCIVTFLMWHNLSAQERLPAFAMNERLGRGINMGNAFEAPSESAWGNPWKPEYFKIISQLGFKHVRLPVRWEPADRSLVDPPYTISPAFLARIQQVVDTALHYNLHIIVNMHHHELLYENPVTQKDRFISQWNQIANHFKNYPDKLLFEVLNEPHGNLTPTLWNEFFAEALVEIRKTNPTRVVLMGVAEYGGLSAIAQLQLPNDEHIILSPHYYNPFNFTHQGAEWVNGADPWLGTEWNDTEADRETIASEFAFAFQFSAANNIPIHVGEFGAYSKADISSRTRWTTFLSRWFEEKKLSWAYWEFSAGFGIYNSTTKELVTPLVEALMHNTMPQPSSTVATPIYTSNFNSGTDGWQIFSQGGALSALTASGGKLNVSITNGGTETWHVQLVKNNLLLEQGKMYRISFKAVADANRSATFYVGKASSPWNAYSGYNALTIGTVESSFSYTFNMTSETDPAARLVFDFGKSTSAISILNIKVEEISLLTTAIENTGHSEISVFPNPFSSTLFIENHDQYHTATLFNLHGKLLAIYNLKPNINEIQAPMMPQGVYLLHLKGNDPGVFVRLIKE